MTTREEWKAAKRRVEKIEAQRDEATKDLRAQIRAIEAQTDAELDAATLALEELEDQLDDRIGSCENCSEPIFEGDRHFGREYLFCLDCAPTWQEFKDHPDQFTGPGDEPYNADEAAVLIDKHLADGGSLSDSMARS